MKNEVTTVSGVDARETHGHFCVRASMDGPERLDTVVVPSSENLARLIADRIATLMQRRAAEGRPCVLGLATGSTPLGIYHELIERHRAGELDFSHVVTFNLDEYYPMQRESVQSYHRYMWENLFDHINIAPENVHIPSGDVGRDQIEEACREYEQRIADAGGIDFQIAGIGRSGHIGFNEPGSKLTSRTRLVTLDAITRKDAAADFFSEESVPTEAVTVGVATILEAREIALIATGEHKARIVQRAIEGDVSPDVAATYLQRHPNATAYVDSAAAAELTRVKTPWLLGHVEWTAEMVDRAVVWLADQTNKAILKLTSGDYAANHLSSLLAAYGSASPINGEVFNRLLAKVRGRAKLPKRQKIIVFSPHPDDDVISMGGALRKLRQNGNEIVVAYMTSGNVAVFDHDVRRHLDFLERAAEILELERAVTSLRRIQLEGELADKRLGERDSADILQLKRIIRESEAISALEALGVPASAARFLDMPFYRTGEVRKLPIGEGDVAMVRELLERVQPDLIFVAGDLSDPHGTHRMCKAAIERALETMSGERPEVWLYRGAWQEWSVTDADVLIPLSRDELRAKILAIFKHESQKDLAPFPGAYDDREFWQRTEARNLGTAAQADRLGLPEYYAMEAYVIQPPPD